MDTLPLQFSIQGLGWNENTQDLSRSCLSLAFLLIGQSAPVLLAG